jgi:phospholipase/lecithinase/hemolysin
VLQWTLVVLIAVALATPTAVAGEMTFKSIVVFGDSLSDPGNDFALIHEQNTPPYDNIKYLDQLIIPHVPYAKGGHHYSNGATWVEQFARLRGLAQYVTPAWQSAGAKAANYAVGGGRARDDGDQTHRNLPQQASQFLKDVGYQAPSDTLYVIEFGGNDLRDVLTSRDLSIIFSAVESIRDNILILNGFGAKKFLVWKVPDLSLTPAIIAMDSMTPGVKQGVYDAVFAFNYWLDVYLSGLAGIELKRFDAASAVQALVRNPEAYGLEVVDKACVTPKVPPFDCKEPDEYLFWDGIHPTKTAHGIFAQEVAALLSQ